MKTRVPIDWTEPSPFDGAVPVTTQEVKDKKARAQELLQKLKEVTGAQKPSQSSGLRQLCLL